VKLHSPGFERALRRKIRNEVRGTPDLKQQLRAARKTPNRNQHGWVVRPFCTVLFAVSLWHLLEKAGHLATGLAGISAWCLLFFFVQAQRLQSGLYASSDLPALMLLPFPPGKIFRWQLQKALRGTLWLLLDLATAFSALAYFVRLPPERWAAVVLVAVLAWAQVVGLAVLAINYLPRFPYALASSGLIGGVFVLFVARGLVGNLILQLMEHCAVILNLVLPTGWPVAVFNVVLPGGGWLPLLLLLPIAATLAVTRTATARLREKYRFSEPLIPDAPDLVAREGDPEDAADLGPGNPLRLGPTAIEDLVRTRQFLAPAAWRDQGWLESFLWRKLSPRERVLSEFAFPHGVMLLRPWWRIGRLLAIFALVGLAAGFVHQTAQVLILGLGLLVTGCMVLTRVLHSGGAFRTIMGSGFFVPVSAVYGIGFHELSRLLLKCTFVQGPFVVAYVVAVCALFCFVARLPLGAGCGLGIKIAGLLLAGRFIALAGSFSSGTNDTSRIRWKSFCVLGPLALVGAGFLGLAAASLFVSHPAWSWLCLVLAAFDAWFFHRLYGWFYQRNWFDLMNFPRQ
jgi:hypothetical protein